MPVQEPVLSRRSRFDIVKKKEKRQRKIVVGRCSKVLRFHGIFQPSAAFQRLGVFVERNWRTRERDFIPIIFLLARGRNREIVHERGN